ncbi:MAG: phosphoribosylformylglycinamidine cyclo-ligase [bacterium]
MTKKKVDYKSAGVDIESGEEAVDRIKSLARSTFTDKVLTDIGKFGGFFSLRDIDMDDPILVSSIDGVGTKLKVASLADKHDTIGEDLVNHCIDDILAGGAQPLFFLDYIGTGKLSPDIIEQIVSGMARGCKAAGCALIGGEMAEMPGFYQSGDYDLVGTIVGVVDRKKVIDGSRIEKGDRLIGLASTGLHTNGYSLARKVLFDLAGYSIDSHIDELGTTVGEALLWTHRCYLQIILSLLQKFDIHGLSHITGGGIYGNTRRILPEGRKIEVDWDSWEMPDLFKLIQKKGEISDQEMRKVFNCGIGYVIIVSNQQAPLVLSELKAVGEKPVEMGRVT